MMILRIGWRNLWRNRRRTQLTMGPMIFACAMLVFSLGYYDGFLWSLINNATEKENGHIFIALPGYYANPTLEDACPEAISSQILPDVKAEIKGVCPRLQAYALLSCGTDEENRTQPAQIIAVDYQAELANSKLAGDIVTGGFLTGDEREILLGQGLARRIRADIGSEIIFFSNAADGSIASEILLVKGIFSSGENIRDSSLAIMNLKAAQQLLALDGRVHSHRLFLRDPMQAEEIAARLNASLKTLEATPWQSIFPQIADILKVWLGVQLFTVAIYYAAMALITFNTMYMAFLERMHEFAVMQAIGLTRRLLAVLILSESIIMATASGLIGTAIGACANFILFYHPIDLSRWMESITWGGSSIQPILFCVPSLLSNLLPLLAMILLGFAVAVLPTWRLYRLRPVEALREG